MRLRYRPGSLQPPDPLWGVIAFRGGGFSRSPPLSGRGLPPEINPGDATELCAPGEHRHCIDYLHALYCLRHIMQSAQKRNEHT